MVLGAILTDVILYHKQNLGFPVSDSMFLLECVRKSTARSY